MIIAAQYFVGTRLKVWSCQAFTNGAMQVPIPGFPRVIPEDFATAHRITFISEQVGMLICGQCKTFCEKLEPCNDGQPWLVIFHTSVKQSRCLSSNMSHCFYQFTAKQNCKEDFSFYINSVRAICFIF